MFEVGTDGHIGLDVHHDQMLAMLHGHEADLGADRRFACGVDHHVDQRAGTHQVGVVGNRDAPLANGLLQRAGRLHNPVRLRIMPGRRQCSNRCGNVDVGNRRHHDAAHLQHLGHDVGAHHARTDQADADRFAGGLQRSQVSRQAAGLECAHIAPLSIKMYICVQF